RHTEFQRKTIAWQSGAFPNRVRLASPPTVYNLTDGDTESGGIVWHLNAEKTISLYGNLNRSFNPEFRTQPDGSLLHPEVGKQKEAGLRFNLLHNRINALVSYFDLLQDNVTEADPLNPGFFIQRSGQRSTGLEFSLNGRVTDNWLVMASYANTDARDD